MRRPGFPSLRGWPRRGRIKPNSPTVSIATHGPRTLVLPSGQVTRRVPVDDEMRYVEAVSVPRLPADVRTDRPDQPHAVIGPAAHDQLGIDVPGVEQVVTGQQPLGRQCRMDRPRLVHVRRHRLGGLHVRDQVDRPVLARLGVVDEWHLDFASSFEHLEFDLLPRPLQARRTPWAPSWSCGARTGRAGRRRGARRWPGAAARRAPPGGPRRGAAR